VVHNAASFQRRSETFKEITKPSEKNTKRGGELVCYQSMFRMNRFPLQTSYIPVCPILIDHAWLHLISSQTHYTFIASFFDLPYIPFPPVFLCVLVSFTGPLSCYSFVIVNARCFHRPFYFLTECNQNCFLLLLFFETFQIPS
jgi:hypothetical protein